MAGEEESWALVAEGFDPLNERGAEAVFAVANGQFGIRAALEEGNPASNPMIIVAGVFVPTSGPAGQTLLTLPDPSTLFVSAETLNFSMSSVRTNSHSRKLDMREATLHRTWSFTDRHGRSWLWRSQRLACASRPELYLYRLVLSLETGEGPQQIVVALPNVADKSPLHWPAQEEPPTTEPQTWAKTWLFVDGKPALLTKSSIAAEVNINQPLVLDLVSEVIAREQRPNQKNDLSWEKLADEHKRVWRDRWSLANTKIQGDDILQQSLRFASYHLMSSATVNDGLSSIGPRDLSGIAYHGHVFWDTELFILPFLSLLWPEAARSCLLYRYRTLDAARHRAKSFGYRGAMYAWESTDTGEDRTPDFVALPDGSAVRVLNGEQENHVTSAVAYAVIEYWRATGDDDFMRDFGGEILFECARFWHSRVSPSDHLYSIRRVIGPDEYHEGVDNNAYTNGMARWTLLEAESYATKLRESDPEAAESLMKRLHIKPNDPQEWRRVGERIKRSTFLKDELVEQFDGFFSLQPVDVASYLRAGVPLDIAVGHEAVQRMRAVKQADVLMAIRLLPELWTEAAARKNVAYYEPMTAHTSSLSPPIHALIAAWIRDDALCRKYLDQSIGIDMVPPFRGAAGGVRIGSLGALRQTVAFGLAGLKFNAESISFDPFLPSGTDNLEYSFLWQKRRVDIRIGAKSVMEVRIDGAPARVRVNMEERLVEPGHWQSFSYDPAVTFWSAIGRKGDSDVT
jgi:kojibiose phosphorylase